MELYFIRHTSVAVPKGFCYGNTDVELNDTFEQEAEQVRLQLEELNFDAVFTSPLTRAVRLAEYCGYADAVRDERVREFNFGEWEMKSYEELYATDERFRHWCDNYIEECAPGGESLLDQMVRVNAFIDEKLAQGLHRVAVFCHGGILALALHRAGLAEVEGILASVPPYGTVLRVEL